MSLRVPSQTPALWLGSQLYGNGGRTLVPREAAGVLLPVSLMEIEASPSACVV